MELNNKNLSIHFHVPVFIEKGEIYAPFYYGVWVDEISKCFNKTYLITYTVEEKSQELNYKIKNNTISIVNLGNKKRLILIYFYLKKYINKIKEIINDVDVFIYRAPTPLATHFLRVTRFKKNVLLLVANNSITLEAIKFRNPIRYIFWKIFWIYDNMNLSIMARNCLVMSNGPGFIKDFKNILNQKIIFTSTISSDDIVKRSFNKIKMELLPRLLFVGRLSPEKDIETLLKSIFIDGVPVCSKLTIAGGGEYAYLKNLKDLIPNDFQNIVKFVGHVNSQKEIFNLMDDSDLLILPSKWDFQPRIAWESLSRGLPVICSKSVSSLYFQFNSSKVIKFFKAGDANDLRKTIINFKYWENSNELSTDAYEIANSRTVEKSIQLQLKLIANYAKK